MKYIDLEKVLRNRTIRSILEKAEIALKEAEYCSSTKYVEGIPPERFVKELITKQFIKKLGAIGEVDEIDKSIEVFSYQKTVTPDMRISLPAGYTPDIGVIFNNGEIDVYLLCSPDEIKLYSVGFGDRREARIAASIIPILAMEGSPIEIKHEGKEEVKELELVEIVEIKVDSRNTATRVEHVLLAYCEPIGDKCIVYKPVLKILRNALSEGGEIVYRDLKTGEEKTIVKKKRGELLA